MTVYATLAVKGATNTGIKEAAQMRTYTEKELLKILRAYHKQIERGAADFPTVVLGDIKKSIEFVLKEAGENV
jgi:hypothetical protein